MVVVYKLLDNPSRFVGGELCLVYSSYPFVGEIDSNILVLMELLPQAPYELPRGVMEHISNYKNSTYYYKVIYIGPMVKNKYHPNKILKVGWWVLL